MRDSRPTNGPELAELLRGSEAARNLYWEMVEQDAHLQEVVREAAGRDLARMAANELSIDQDSMALADIGERGSRTGLQARANSYRSRKNGRAWRPVLPSRRRWFLASGIVAVAICAAIGFVIWPSAASRGERLATLHSLSGDVWIVDRQQASVKAASGQPFFAGEAQRVGREGVAELTLADGSSVALGADSVFRFVAADDAASMRMHLEGGAADVEAAAHLGRFCVRCHGASKAEAQFRLDLGPAAFPETTWEKLVDVLHDAAMPPKDEPQPTVAQRQELTAWARGHLDRLVLARAGDPGSVAGRRLTILELENMVRDLTGQALPIRDLLGQDTAGGEGFTNIGSAQSSMTASLLDKYLSLASRVTDHARFDEQGRIVFDPPGKFASPRVREEVSIVDLGALHDRVLIGLYYRNEKQPNKKHIDEQSWKGFGRYMTAVWLATAAPDPQAVLPQLAERMDLNPRFLETVWDRWTTCPPDSLEHRALVGPVKALPKPTAWTDEPPAAISLACDTAGAWFWDLVRGNLGDRERAIQSRRLEWRWADGCKFKWQPHFTLFTAVNAKMLQDPRMKKVPLEEFPVFVAVQQEPYWPLTGGQPVAGWLGWPQIRVTETRTETVDGKARQTTSSSYRPLPQEAVEVLSVAAGRQAGRRFDGPGVGGTCIRRLR